MPLRSAVLCLVLSACLDPTEHRFTVQNNAPSDVQVTVTSALSGDTLYRATTPTRARSIGTLGESIVHVFVTNGATFRDELIKSAVLRLSIDEGSLGTLYLLSQSY